MVAIIANTMEAAPRRPDQETRSCWESLLLKGVSTVETATGRAINVSHTAISNAGTMTCGMRDGKESRPSKKKISICISPVRPSKRRTGKASNMILYLCKKYRRKRPVVHVMQRFTPQHLNIKPDKKVSAAMHAAETLALCIWKT